MAGVLNNLPRAVGAPALIAARRVVLGEALLRLARARDDYALCPCRTFADRLGEAEQAVRVAQERGGGAPGQP